MIAAVCAGGLLLGVALGLALEISRGCLLGAWELPAGVVLVASVPVIIFEYSEQPDRHLNAQAWAAAFVLIAFVLVTSLLARAALERSRRKLGNAA